MTQPDQALLGRINADVAVIWSYLGRVTADLRELDRVVAHGAPGPAVARPEPYWAPPVTPQPVPVQVSSPASAPMPTPAPTPMPVAAPPPAPPAPVAPPVTGGRERSEGWIGKVLAVAGVAVTLVGVVLLLVLAAQAGILSPGIRVGMGAMLAGGLVAVGFWLNRRPGGRVGSISLAATGIAAAYIDIVAVTAIYHWFPGAVGLVLAAVVAGGGLMIARLWDSEHLALLVLVPMLVLGPAVVGGITLLLVGFMLALSAATLPVQLGKNWLGMHAARIAVGTLPLLIALVAPDSPSPQPGWLAAAFALGALLAIASAVLLLPHSSHPVALALCSAAGTLPVLAASFAVTRVTAALMAAVLAFVLVALVAVGGRALPALRRADTVWSALAAVSLLVAITVAFDGAVAGLLLLAVAVMLAVAARKLPVAQWSAMGFGFLGGMYYLVYAPPSNLTSATEVSGATAVTTLVSSLLVVACAVAIAWPWVSRPHTSSDVSGVLWVAAAIISMYAITMLTVTAGVLLGGPEAGFFSGHMAATICWIALAAVVFRYAAKVSRTQRSLPIAAGLALVAAAMAKLFLFDLGTLGGIFRVIVFIVVGLALLGMGAGYARLLAQQDEKYGVDEAV